MSKNIPQKKITKFDILMNLLRISKIKDITLIKDKQKYIHVYLLSSKTIPYDIFIYNSNIQDDVHYVKTNQKQDILFLENMEELCENCEKFKLLIRLKSKLHIYATHHTIKEFTPFVYRSPSISPTPTCWDCFTRKTSSRGGKKKKVSKTKKIYR